MLCHGRYHRIHVVILGGTKYLCSYGLDWPIEGQTEPWAMLSLCYAVRGMQVFFMMYGITPMLKNLSK